MSVLRRLSTLLFLFSRACILTAFLRYDFLDTVSGGSKNNVGVAIFSKSFSKRRVFPRYSLETRSRRGSLLNGSNNCISIYTTWLPYIQIYAAHADLQRCVRDPRLRARAEKSRASKRERWSANASSRQRQCYWKRSSFGSSINEPGQSFVPTSSSPSSRPVPKIGKEENFYACTLTYQAFFAAVANKGQPSRARTMKSCGWV